MDKTNSTNCRLCGAPLVADRFLTQEQLDKHNAHRAVSFPYHLLSYDPETNDWCYEGNYESPLFAEADLRILADGDLAYIAW